VKKLSIYAVYCILVFSIPAAAQNLQSHIQEMQKSYASSGTIVDLNNQTLLIQPNMPGPICGLPKNENGKTMWSFYTFPLASITVPLAQIDDSFIAEDVVFTGQDAPAAYKPGDVGDTMMIVVVGVPGKQFRAVTYDRDKLTHLGPGPHNGSAYGEAPDNVEAFGLTFTDRTAARAFVAALRGAVQLARTQATLSHPAVNGLPGAINQNRRP
jgi:hypothetical protein